MIPISMLKTSNATVQSDEDILNIKIFLWTLMVATLIIKTIYQICFSFLSDIQLNLQSEVLLLWVNSSFLKNYKYNKTIKTYKTLWPVRPKSEKMFLKC